MAHFTRRYTIESFPYIRVLLILYVAYYGAILLYSQGLPYVTDANESFSIYWHSYNLLHFDITKSFGLTDEAYGPSPAAHPYLHTHQGNMPRLFGALIYILGANSIEAQIIVTTAVIGTAGIMFAFFTMRRLANPPFAFIFATLLLTDYLQFAQWNVVTYRVWYGFLFFAILLSVMRAGEARGHWAMAALFGSFALLFYNELVFAGLVTIIAGLFTAYWHRARVRLVVKLWIIEFAGAATALTILVAQLLAKFGWNVVKQDFAATFISRNLSDSTELGEATVNFFNQHHIVFWLNLSDSTGLRKLTTFIKLQTTHIFQLYTPWLTMLAVVVVGAFLLSAVLDKRFGAFLLQNQRKSQLRAPSHNPGPWLIGMLTALIAMALILVSVPTRAAFDTYDLLLGIIIGIAVAQLAWVTATHRNWPRRLNGIALLRNPDLRIVVQVLALATVGFFCFARPASHVLVSRIALTAAVGAIWLFYDVPRHDGSIRRAWHSMLSQLRTRYAAVRSGQSAGYLGSVSVRFSAFDHDATFEYQCRDHHWVVAAYAIALLLLFICLGGGAEVFGIASPPGLNDFSLMHWALAFILALIFSQALTGRLSRLRKFPILRVAAFTGFIAMITLFISYQYRLYDQDFSVVWKLPLRFPGAELIGRLLVVASVLFAGSLIVLGWRRLIRVRDAKALADPLALLIIGEIALAVIFCLSPGYVISGYLQRGAPFAVFFTSLLIAMMFYLLAVTGRHAQSVLRRWVNSNDLPRRAVLIDCIAPSRITASVIAFGLLLALSLYWIALQSSYARALPPNYFAVLKDLRNPPFAGKSAVASTYAAPVAAMTGQWAYFDSTFFLNVLYRTDSGYVVEQDMTNNLWLADRETNVEYRRPDYFVCLWPQSLRNIVADRGQGFSSFHDVCPRMPIVIAAAKRTGLMRHRLIAADPSPRGSWAIVKLDHELPPLAQGVTATLSPGENGLTAKASYHYFHQDGTPEDATLIELVGSERAPECALDATAEVFAKGRAGDILNVPRDFSGTIALRITPVSMRKAGEATLSNQFIVHAGAAHATACPLDLAFDFGNPNVWRKHAAAGLTPAGPAGSYFGERQAKLVIDIPAPANGTVDMQFALGRNLHNQDLQLAYEVNGERFGPFRVGAAETSIKHTMQIPAAVLRRAVPVVVSITIEDNEFEAKQVALRRLVIRAHDDD